MVNSKDVRNSFTNGNVLLYTEEGRKDVEKQQKLRKESKRQKGWHSFAGKL